MEKIGIVLSASDIGFQSPSDAELRRALSTLSVSEFAPFLGRLSSALHLQLEREGLQRQLAEFMLAPRLRELLYIRGQKEVDKGNVPFWVVPAQLRVVLKLLLECGSVQGGKGRDSQTALKHLGSAILSVQPTYRDAVDLGPKPRDSKEHLYDLLRFKHSATLDSSRPFQTLSLKEALYERIYQDEALRLRFHERYGVDPFEVHRGLAALWVAFSVHDADLLRHPAEFVVDHRMLFGRFSVSRAAGALILDRLSRDLRVKADMPKEAEGVPWSSDLRFLVEKPLGMLDENLVCCLDFDFLRSSYARLLFNLTTEMLGASEANRLVRQVGGDILEKSAETWFAAVAAERPEPRSTVRTSFRLPGNLEVDVVVTEDNEVALFELKSGVLPASLVFGTSVDALAAAIDKKYVKLDKGKPYGFTQLARAARLILDDPTLVGLKRVKRLHAVLVVEDDDLPSKPAASYVIAEARKVLAPLGSRVGAPILLHIEDLAILAERSRRYGIPYMLKRLWREGFIGLTFRDLVFERLPVSDAERVDLSRPFPLTDPILDDAAASGPDWPTLLCPVCGSVEKVFTSSSGKLVHRCGSCVDSQENDLPEESAQASKDADRQWIAEYESS